MDHHAAGAGAPVDDIDHILWSARRAGTLLILPRGHSAEAIERLERDGLVRRQIGHVVLTLRGQERRRRSAHVMALSA